MAQSPGVFSLENVEVKLREGEWATRADWWRDESTPNTGYQLGGGGAPDYNKSGISKTQYATDTTGSISPFLLNVGGGGSTTTSSTALYAHAGTNLPGSPPSTTKTDKITYSTDTVSSLPGSIPAPSSQGFNNSTRGIMGDNKAGYFAGGTNWPSNQVLSNIWKMPFATESVGQTPSGMPQNMTARSAFSSATHGYMAGGYWPSGGSDSRIYKMSFATDSGSNFSTPGPGNISPSKNGAGSSSPTDGYIVGGDYNYVYKTPFSTDTSSRLPSSNYPLSEVSGQAASGNTTHTYNAGGQGGPSGNRSSIFKFNYSTGSWSTIASMPSVRQFPKGGGSKSAPAGIYGAFSRASDNATEDGNYTYQRSGSGPSNNRRTHTARLDMSTDVSQSMPSITTPQQWRGANFGNSTAGYMAGGSGNPASYNRLTYLTYATEVNYSDANAFPGPIGDWVSGVDGGGNGKGYAGMGSTPSPYRGRVYPFTYATWTTGTAIDGAGGQGNNLYRMFAVGNQKESYWGGGDQNNSFASRTWKFAFSSETFALQPGLNVELNPSGPAYQVPWSGSGIEEKGLVKNSSQNGQTINYSQGTLLQTPFSAEGPNNNDRGTHTANSKAAYYLMGGGYKYDWATNTPSDIGYMPLSPWTESMGSAIRGQAVTVAEPPETTPTSGLGFTYNPALPNFAMNAGTSDNTRFVKLDYATDVMTTVPGQFIYVPNQYYNRRDGGAASSATAGYFAGGSGGPGQSSGSSWQWVDKYTYSSDTQSRMPDGTGIGTKNKPAAGNHEKAYWVAGGEYPQSSRDVSKLVFSTGAWTTQPSARPGATVRNMKVAGGPTEVWCLGGQYVQPNNQPSATPSYNATTIGKITYSNDTYSTIPSGTGANVPGGYARAMSNSTAMYTGGAGTPVDKFTFSTTTNALFSSIAYSVPAAASASNETHGYWIGGKTPAGGSKAQKLSFASGTVTVTPAPNPSTEINNQSNSMATSARSDANAGTSGPTIL